jgi:hypothetical protein
LEGDRILEHVPCQKLSDPPLPPRHTQLAATRMCRLPSLALNGRTRTSAWAGARGGPDLLQSPLTSRDRAPFLANGGAMLKRNARNLGLQRATATATNGNVHVIFASSRLRLWLRPTVVAMTPDDAMSLSIELQKAAIDARQDEYHGTSCVAFRRLKMISRVDATNAAAPPPYHVGMPAPAGFPSRTPSR